MSYHLNTYEGVPVLCCHATAILLLMFVLFFYTPRRASVCLAYEKCPHHPSAAVLTILTEVCFHQSFQTNTGKSYSITDL